MKIPWLYLKKRYSLESKPSLGEGNTCTSLFTSHTGMHFYATNKSYCLFYPSRLSWWNLPSKMAPTRWTKSEGSRSCTAWCGDRTPATGTRTRTACCRKTPPWCWWSLRGWWASGLWISCPRLTRTRATRWTRTRSKWDSGWGAACTCNGGWGWSFFFFLKTNKI